MWVEKVKIRKDSWNQRNSVHIAIYSIPQKKFPAERADFRRSRFPAEDADFRRSRFPAEDADFRSNF